MTYHYHRSHDMDRKDKDSVRYFLYVSSSGDVLNVSAREITKSKRKASNVQNKKWIGMVFVVFKSRHRKVLGEEADAVSSVVDSSADFPDPAFDVPIIKDEIDEEDSPWDIRDLTFKNSRGPSTLQRIQRLCRTYGLSVHSDVQSVQGVSKDAFEVFFQQVVVRRLS